MYYELRGRLKHAKQYQMLETDMVSNFSRAHRSQRDKGPVCQDWLDLDIEHSLNTIDSMDTLTEPVDGKQKVWFWLFSALITTNSVIAMETKPLSHYINVHVTCDPNIWTL